MVSPAKTDYYEILGIVRAGNVRRNQVAYRKAALTWHPDRNREQKKVRRASFATLRKRTASLSDAQKRGA